eukprot:14842220-Alexandrium_andersonii.AAC.1
MLFVNIELIAVVEIVSPTSVQRDGHKLLVRHFVICAPPGDSVELAKQHQEVRDRLQRAKNPKHRRKFPREVHAISGGLKSVPHLPSVDDHDTL